MDTPTAPRPSARSVIGGVLRRLGLSRVVAWVAEREARRLASRREAEWRDALDVALAGRMLPELRTGDVDTTAVAVIVCLWNRPDRLGTLLEQLAAQRDSPAIRLILWNNNPEFSERYRAELARVSPSRALASVEYLVSPVNLGGVARFVVARHLRDSGYEGPFITLDDDQNISSSFVRDLLEARLPGGIAGWWAFRSTEHYWDRVPVKPGDDATYVGTGGAVFDTSIVADLEFFHGLPARYGFLEDMWANDWVLRHGGRLTKVDTTIEFVQQELDQYHGLGDLKVEFARYLTGR